MYSFLVTPANISNGVVDLQTRYGTIFEDLIIKIPHHSETHEPKLMYSFLRPSCPQKKTDKLLKSSKKYTGFIQVLQNYYVLKVIEIIHLLINNLFPQVRKVAVVCCCQMVLVPNLDQLHHKDFSHPFR